MFPGVSLFPVFAFQILVLELNDEAAEQTVEAKVVDLLQGQEGFRWKVASVGLVTAKQTHYLSLSNFKTYLSLPESCDILQYCYISFLLYPLCHHLLLTVPTNP